MSRMSFFLVCLALLAPGLLESETLHLRDGSSLKGRLVRVGGDTLYFETLLGPVLRVHKEKVSGVEFLEGAVFSSTGAGPSMGSIGKPGTLRVSFEKLELTSRIASERDRHREACERENVIEQALFVDGSKVYSVIDSTTDKVIRRGPDTILRNDMKPEDFEVTAPPGLHQCVIVIGNTRASDYIERFDPAPLDKKLVVDNVYVEPGGTTHIRVGLKRKTWRMGKSELFRVN